jgi:hypothetical protein
VGRADRRRPSLTLNPVPRYHADLRFRCYGLTPPALRGAKPAPGPIPAPIPGLRCAGDASASAGGGAAATARRCPCASGPSSTFPPDRPTTGCAPAEHHGAVRPRPVHFVAC